MPDAAQSPSDTSFGGRRVAFVGSSAAAHVFGQWRAMGEALPAVLSDASVPLRDAWLVSRPASPRRHATGGAPLRPQGVR
jgi:hypothetical protein